MTKPASSRAEGTSATMGDAYPGGAGPRGRGIAGCQNPALLDLARTLAIILSNLLISCLQKRIERRGETGPHMSRAGGQPVTPFVQFPKRVLSVSDPCLGWRSVMNSKDSSPPSRTLESKGRNRHQLLDRLSVI